MFLLGRWDICAGNAIIVAGGFYYFYYVLIVIVFLGGIFVDFERKQYVYINDMNYRNSSGFFCYLLLKNHLFHYFC
jgi:hypothetical protein